MRRLKDALELADGITWQGNVLISIPLSFRRTNALRIRFYADVDRFSFRGTSSMRETD